MIPLEQIAEKSLRELMKNEAHNGWEEEYNYIEELVRGALFSRYAKRKKWLLKGLQKATNDPIKIATQLDYTNGTLYAYITTDNERYIFVREYPWRLELDEPEPSRLERLQWKIK